MVASDIKPEAPDKPGEKTERYWGERFSIPGVGGILLRACAGAGGRGTEILIQERFKASSPLENGLLEIPAGKVREYENVYDCLRREVMEETGLTLARIEGEEDARTVEAHGYRVLSYEPFASSQNLSRLYPILVQVFICHVDPAGGEAADSPESRNARWVGLQELRDMLERENDFYPMHIDTLRKLLRRSGLL